MSIWNNDIDNNKFVLSVFLDLKRSFATIDTSILPEKLKHNDVERTVLVWDLPQ